MEYLILGKRKTPKIYQLRPRCTICEGRYDREDVYKCVFCDGRGHMTWSQYKHIEKFLRWQAPDDDYIVTEPATTLF